jgi:lipopolysaccharide export system protein LptA
MSKLFFIVKFIIAVLIIHTAAFSAPLIDAVDKSMKSPVVITSESLVADNKKNTATFEGSVVAKTEDIIMQSDRMTVYYDNAERKVIKIHAEGNVKVNKEERALFSDEAIYVEAESKIIFTGSPRAVEGENVISGTQIIFHIDDERVVVEGSRVILQNTKGQTDAFTGN